MNAYEMTGDRCRAPMCTSWANRRSVNEGLTLCQDHMLRAWKVIQDEIDGGMKPLTPGRELVPGSAPRPVGHVYYIRVGDMIKIGHSRSIDDRLSVYPPKSELIGMREGSTKLERAEHLRYSEHLEYGREWFVHSDWLHADIEREDDTRPLLTQFGDDGFREGDDEDGRPPWQRHRATPTSKVEFARKVV